MENWFHRLMSILPHQRFADSRRMGVRDPRVKVPHPVTVREKERETRMEGRIDLDGIEKYRMNDRWIDVTRAEILCRADLGRADFDESLVRHKTIYRTRKGNFLLVARLYERYGHGDSERLTDSDDAVIDFFLGDGFGIDQADGLPERIRRKIMDAEA